MQIFNCKVMRSVVVVSTVVFGLGLVLQLPTIVAWLQSPSQRLFYLIWVCC